MKRKQKRTHMIGALIFVALVAVVGFGLVATGNLRNPLNFLGEIQQQISSGAPTGHDAGGNRGPGQGQFTPGGNSGQGQFGPGRGPDQGNPGSGGGPDTENNGGIAWNQIGGVFSDLWVLSAIVACYILIQQTQRLINNRILIRKYSQSTT